MADDLQFDGVESDGQHPHFVLESLFARGKERAGVVEQIIEQRAGGLRSDLDAGDGGVIGLALGAPFVRGFHPAPHGGDVRLARRAGERAVRQADGEGEPRVGFERGGDLGQCAVEQGDHLGRAGEAFIVERFDGATPVVGARTDVEGLVTHFDAQRRFGGFESNGGGGLACAVDGDLGQEFDVGVCPQPQFERAHAGVKAGQDCLWFVAHGSS